MPPYYHVWSSALNLECKTSRSSRFRFFALARVRPHVSVGHLRHGKLLLLHGYAPVRMNGFDGREGRRRALRRWNRRSRLDPPPIKGRAETSLALDALEVQIRDPPAEAHGIPSRPRPMERTAELPMLHNLVDGKPSTIGPVDDERVDAALIGDAGVNADVLLPGSVCRYVMFVV